ncbi:MAG: hypothetical protein WCT49_02370 [Candidatus Paceibacterota bacterium]|jgi:hypothetical protein|nr:hypothetical protein [Candidatus Paceibacterota bacterium]
MKRVQVPANNWGVELAKIIKTADDDTVIVVKSDAQKELALRAANRLGCNITVEVVL